MIIRKEKIVSFLNKTEPYYFYLFLLFSTLPVISFQFFPTSDGPAHLYNFRLILEILKNNSNISDYLKFTAISPNWLSHIILTGLLTVLPASAAEKILLLFYIVGFPLSFRGLLKSLPAGNQVMVYFIFSFTYSFLFFGGMYNFHLGMVFLFWAVTLIIKYNGDYTIKRIAILLVLSTLIYISHLFTLSIYLMILSVFNFKYLRKFFISDSKSKLIIVKQIAFQIVFLSAGIILMIRFILTNLCTHNSQLIYINPGILFHSLLDMQPARGINYGKAAIYTRWIFYSFLLTLIYLIVSKLYHLIISKKQSRLVSFSATSDYWLLFCIISMVLLFIMPDGNSSFGFISSRLILFIFLFLIIWLYTQNSPVWLKTITFLLINYANIALLKMYFIYAKNENIEIHDIREAAYYIKPNSVILPVNYTKSLFSGHISNYLGIEKPMVILENYEAVLDYFPLQWDVDKIPNLMLCNQSWSSDCFNWIKMTGTKRKKLTISFY